MAEKLPREFTAEPNEDISIPKELITCLKYEIVVLDVKKVKLFRCQNYYRDPDNSWRFTNVIIDTSKRNARGDVTLKRVTYYPEVRLVNAGFMVIPAPEKETEGENA